MTKTKQPKPVKAWALVNEHNGRLVKMVLWSRGEARSSRIEGERIVRVEIKVLK